MHNARKRISFHDLTKNSCTSRTAFDSNLSLQANIYLHISTAFLHFSTLYIGVCIAHASDFPLFTMCLFQFVPLYSTHRSSRLECRLAHQGDPENHIPMIHLSPAHANSLRFFIASTFFISSILGASHGTPRLTR